MGNLTIPSTAVTLSNLVNCSAVVIDQPAAGTLAPGTSDTFEIEVTPTAPGPFSVDVSVDSDDPDEDPYTYTLSGIVDSPKIQITPDLGLPISQQFDPMQNPQLVEIGSSRFIDIIGQVVEATYKSARKLRFNADIGFGTQAYELPADAMVGRSILKRKYLWRVDSDPNTIGTFRMVP